jgi:hypothetical protein
MQPHFLPFPLQNPSWRSATPFQKKVERTSDNNKIILDALREVIGTVEQNHTQSNSTTYEKERKGLEILRGHEINGFYGNAICQRSKVSFMY